MTNLEVFQTWMSRVWTQQDSGAIDQMFLPDGLAEGLGEKMIGPDDFKQFHGQLLGIIDNVEVQVLRHIQDDTWISVLCQLDCTDRKNNSQRLQITGTVIARIENDCIVEAYNHFDFLSLFEQLQLLPNGTFAKCLGGTAVGG